MPKPDTPNLDRITEVRHESNVIGDFLEWLWEQGYVICERTRGHHLYFPTERSIEELLAGYFGINLREAEREREAVFQYLISQTMGGGNTNG